MKIALFSDLHAEHRKYDPEYEWFFNDLDPSDTDVAVLAGDIFVARNSLGFLRKFCSLYRNVVFVAGNHEFYGSEFNHVYHKLNGLQQEMDGFENFHFLERNAVELDGCRFVGCTLWYREAPTSMLLEQYFNDFRAIKHANASFRQIVYGYAHLSEIYLANNVKPGDIVVTHMLPLAQCCAERHRNDALNIFYYNDCEAILKKNRPALWLHGHSHNAYDKTIYDTRIIRNPGGYPNEAGVNFNKALKIEL